MFCKKVVVDANWSSFSPDCLEHDFDDLFFPFITLTSNLCIRFFLPGEKKFSVNLVEDLTGHSYLLRANNKTIICLPCSRGYHRFRSECIAYLEEFIKAML